MVFTFALAYSLIRAATLPPDPNGGSVITNMKEALQAVVATLGCLVGSIIGYYFGESSLLKSSNTGSEAGTSKPAPEIQPPPADGKGSEPIKQIEKPTQKGDT